MNIKWKFFYNGYCWWLRIETLEQLEAYCNATDEARFGGAMMQVAYHRKDNIKGHYDGIAGELDVLNRAREEDLLTTTGWLRSEAHKTYFKNFQRFGFVNINRLGGCNGCNWPMLITVTKDNLVFPIYSKKDVTIKTWEMGEKKYGVMRPNYKYHWYAYIGDIRLKDGDIDKWDTKEECEQFVNRLFVE